MSAMKNTTKKKKLSMRGILFRKAKASLLNAQKEMIEVANELEKLPSKDQRWFLDKIKSVDKTLANNIVGNVKI